ncbi:MAG TPA: tetratricopeptide repeat protein [Bacteroidia bacterium]
MKYLFILFILFVSFKSYAQTTAQDYFQAGDDKAWNGDFKGAIPYFTKAIELTPKGDADVFYHYRGNCKAHIKDYQGAIDDYTIALKIDPKSSSAYADRAKAREALKNYKGAIEDYTKCIELTPYGDDYYKRGNAKMKAGDKSGACVDLKKADELGNKDAEEAISKYCK